MVTSYQLLMHDGSIILGDAPSNINEPAFLRAVSPWTDLSAARHKLLIVHQLLVAHVDLPWSKNTILNNSAIMIIMVVVGDNHDDSWMGINKHHCLWISVIIIRCPVLPWSEMTKHHHYQAFSHLRSDIDHHQPQHSESLPAYADGFIRVLSTSRLSSIENGE